MNKSTKDQAADFIREMAEGMEQIAKAQGFSFTAYLLEMVEIGVEQEALVINSQANPADRESRNRQSISENLYLCGLEAAKIVYALPTSRKNGSPGAGE